MVMRRPSESTPGAGGPRGLDESKLPVVVAEAHARLDPAVGRRDVGELAELWAREANCVGAGAASAEGASRPRASAPKVMAMSTVVVCQHLT